MSFCRSLVIVIGLLVIAMPGSGSALAQEQGERPRADEGGEVTEEEMESGEGETASEDGKTEARDDETAALEPVLTETMTVTATRVKTDIMRTPVAVSAFDQETLDNEGVRNLRDMAQLVPNMDIATINGQSTPIIALRGVRSTNETELGDPSVGVHLDGIYSPRMQGILGLMFDNERVEVLRGPQGTLFGRNSTVGSINIISAKPRLDGFDSNIGVQYGNFKAPDLQAMVNIPVSGTIALRFAGRYHKSDSYIQGYWDPNQYDQRFIADKVKDAAVLAPGSFDEDGNRLCTGPGCYTRTQHSNWWMVDSEYGGDDVRALVPADSDDFYFNAKEWGYRISGLWQPKSKDMSLNLGFQHFRSDSSGGVDLVNCEKLRGRPVYDFEYDEEGNLLGVYPAGTNDCSDMFPRDDTYQAVVNTPGKFFLDIKYLRSRFEWGIKENLRFVALAGAEDQARESTQDMEQSLNAWDQAMTFLPGTGSQSWMSEIQFQSQGNRRFNWISGANYFHEKTATKGFFDNAIGEKSMWDQPNRTGDAWALFAQGTYSLTPKWHLTLGYRYSNETKEDKGGTTYICNTVNGCAPSSREELNALPEDYFADSSIYPDSTGNDNKGSWSHNDWRIGLDYDLNENTFLYSYLASGFKAGGIGDVFEQTVLDTGVDENGNPVVFGAEEVVIRTAYDPEEVTTLELGFKQRFPGARLDLRGAFFYTDYENMQYASVGAIGFSQRWQALRDRNGDLIFDENGRLVFGWVKAPVVAYFTQNVPGAVIQGFELEYDARPWKGGQIRGYASWLDTEITEDWITKWDYDPVSYFGLDFADAVDPSNEALQVNLKGNELAVAPPFKFHITVEQTFHLKRPQIAVVPWVTAHWEDDSYLTIWNVDKHTDDLDFAIFDEDIKYTDDKREAWSMLHAGVRFYSGNLMTEMFVYNLTDEVIQWWGGAAEQVPRGSMSVPRTYGVRISYQF